jgi:two-component system response regulator NreC
VNTLKTILLVDDHEMVRAGLRALLQGESGFQVVGEASDGRTAVRLASEMHVDVVIMDVNLPELNGIEATRQIRASGQGTKVIGLSGHSDRVMTTEMLKAGATGYVRKESAFAELAEALAAVVANKVYISPSINAAVIEGFVIGASMPADVTAFGKLTAREREVLQLMAEGKATKQIALAMDLSAKTVETHRHKMMDKLGLFSVAELTKYAIREGLTPLER